MITNNIKELEWTGERYVPQLRGTIALEHLHRYAYACEFVQGKVVLDIASGEGYGSEMLSRTAAHVYGVDVDKKSVVHAAEKYQKDNLEFILGSCEKIPLPDHSVDLIVSFETIEHTEQHDLVLLEMKRVLKPDGFLIISSPEKGDYHEKRNEKNPFHLHELDFEEFQRLLLKHFPQCAFFGQRIISGSQVYKFGEDIHPVAAYELARLPNVTEKSESDLRPTYILGICGQTAASAACGSFCIQRPWETDYCRELDKQIAERDKQIAERDKQIAERDIRIKGLKRAIASIKNSLIWRLSWPIRLIHFKIDKFIKKNSLKKQGKSIYKNENTQENLINIPGHSSSSFQPREHIPKEKMAAADQVVTDIRAIAIYLPQFHAIPENDKWWGSGFTEWTNVRRATPQYKGHYQPHVPHPDLGYYDLNDPSVLEKQAAMAREAGIEGFCFYYYWFNGRRLLNMPTDRLLATGKPDFPFCFCWANENWTRTWDGGDKEILIQQEHSYESDERFILDMLSAFRDTRYIRVDGKPLLIVYRLGILPDPAATARHWRETCRREGIGEIFLANMRMFDWELKCCDTGFDAVIQFPPVDRKGYAPYNKEFLKLNNPTTFTGNILDFEISAARYAFEEFGEKVWPGVCPSWDNTARRMERASFWINSSPEIYYHWLDIIVQRYKRTLQPQQRFVFINAWNEWAEGCHLEPDEKYGYAWLNATRLALTGERPPAAPQRTNILVIGHDAARAGAQMLLLKILKQWSLADNLELRLILIGDGVLRPDFEKICKTIVLTDFSSEIVRNRALANFLDPAPDVILANTVVTGPFLKELKAKGAPIITYVHELQKSIERWAPGEIIDATISFTDHFIAGAKPVALNLTANYGVSSHNISLQEAFINTSKTVLPARIDEIRCELCLGLKDKVVFGCGTIDWRKGPDLFVLTAERVNKIFPGVRFIWIGPVAADDFARTALDMAKRKGIDFIGEKENFFDYFAVGSAFFLSSREDPFPLVALEAADVGLPVVCFAEAGGMPEFVGNTCGRTVPFENIDAASEALVEILSNEQLRFSLGNEAQACVRSKHDATLGSAAVLSILKGMVLEPKSNSIGDTQSRSVESEPLVTVIVPNYNHAKFLPERLASIANQSHGNFEIVLLDDKSTDQSLEILRDFSHRDPRARLIPNSVNSGSTFKQWRKGLSQARGKYIWIAESDDSAHPDLVKSLVGKLEARESAIFAACCPVMTDLNGKPHGIPKEWFADIGASLWESDFSIGGLTLLANVMCKKNAILNASGVVFRNSPEVANLVDDSMRLCADWLFWVRLLEKGDFEYIGKPLNLWRQDSSNARTKPPGELEWEEGSRVIREIADILRMDQNKSDLLMSDFKNKCNKWKNYEN